MELKSKNKKWKTICKSDGITVKELVRQPVKLKELDERLLRMTRITAFYEGLKFANTFDTKEEEYGKLAAYYAIIYQDIHDRVRKQIENILPSVSGKSIDELDYLSIRNGLEDIANGY